MKLPDRKYPATEMELAMADGVDVGFEDHGIFVMFGRVDYGCGAQGFGWCIDVEFIKRFINVFGVRQLSECNGRFCFVEHDSQKIFRLIPVQFRGDDAREFDIEKWSKRKKEERVKNAKRKGHKIRKT